jgi:hypothetical protein
LAESPVPREFHGGFARASYAWVAHVLLTARDRRASELRGIFDEAGLLRRLGVLA